MNGTPVRLEDADGVLRIVLDSPSNRNALSPALVAGVRDGLRRAEEDEGVRAVVLMHTGTTFCAGADLSAAAREANPAGASGGEQDRTAAQQESGRQMVALLDAMLASRVPVVGLIDGHVRAGGMGLVAACDAVIAGPRATFGLSEVRIGVVAAIVSAVICERIDDRTASDWFLTGRKVSREEALAAGFVSTTSEDPHADVDALCREYRFAAPTALAATKKMLGRRIRARLADEAEDLLALSARFFLSAEAQAGMRAFRAKESPPWAPE